MNIEDYEAYQNGWVSQQNGVKRLMNNPYDIEKEAFSYNLWEKGYAARAGHSVANKDQVIYNKMFRQE